MIMKKLSMMGALLTLGLLAGCGGGGGGGSSDGGAGTGTTAKTTTEVMAGVSGSTLVLDRGSAAAGTDANADGVRDPDEATSPGVQPGVERSSRNGLLLFDVLTQDFDWRSTTRRGEVGRGPQNAPALQPRMEVPEFLAQQAR